MASHPYISGPNNVVQMLNHLRKNFPSSVTAETVKRLALAPKNESYVINALQFLAIVDAEGQRTELGSRTFNLHGDTEFREAFAKVVREAYSALFDLRGDEAWSLDKSKLISFFRSADQTSDIIGGRQAGLFIALRQLAGFGSDEAAVPTTVKRPPKAKATTSTKAKGAQVVDRQDTKLVPAPVQRDDKRGLALSVRVEINLPAEASAETYDNIFKSIRANLLND